MKSIGMVRPVDEMGRIVLPKELRRQFNIEDGEDSVEVFVDGRQNHSQKVCACMHLLRRRRECGRVQGPPRMSGLRAQAQRDRRVSTGTEGKKGRPSFPSSFSLDRLPLFAVYCSSFVRE